MNRPLEARELRGTFVALATLLDNDGNINYERQDMLIGDLVRSDINGLVVMGTTGQAATFHYDEHVAEVERTFRFLREDLRSDIPFVVGAGSNDTTKAVELSEMIEGRIGPSTLLHNSFYYLKPQPEAALPHFMRIAESIRGNIILYNVPGRVVSDLGADPVIALHRLNPDKFIGLKQANSGDKGTRDVTRILSMTDRDKFSVVSGEDDAVYSMMELGASGVISATANCCPRLFVNITDAMNKGDRNRASEAQNMTMPYVRYAFRKPGNNPTNVNYLLGSGVRGCNIGLQQGLMAAERISELAESEEYRTRAREWKALIQEGDRLIRESDPAVTGIDLKTYQKN